MTKEETRKYIREYMRQRYKDTPEKIQKHSKNWRRKNSEHIKQYNKQWWEAHPDYKKQYRENNKEHINKQERNRLLTNPQFKLGKNMKEMIRQALAGNKDGRKWENLVGYTKVDLAAWLEKQFTQGMNWNNYGSYWVVDHIIPRSVFNYSAPEHIDFQKCWALNNLQPLTVIGNALKSNNLNAPFQPALAIQNITKDIKNKKEE